MLDSPWKPSPGSPGARERPISEPRLLAVTLSGVASSRRRYARRPSKVPRGAAPVVDPVQRLFSLSLDMLGTPPRTGTSRGSTRPGSGPRAGPARSCWPSRSSRSCTPTTSSGRCEAHGRMAQGDPGIAFENRYRTRDGDYRWFEWTTVAEDGVLYFVGKDVTEPQAARGRAHRGRAADPPAPRRCTGR